MLKCKILAYLDAYLEPNLPQPDKTSGLHYIPAVLISGHRLGTDRSIASRLHY
jgi:hypothetical protein